MWPLTKRARADKSNGQSTAEKKDNKELYSIDEKQPADDFQPNHDEIKQIIQRDEYKGIQLVGIENGWFAALGNKRLTLHYKTKAELTKYLDQKPWEVAVVIAAAVAEEVIQLTKPQ